MESTPAHWCKYIYWELKRFLVCYKKFLGMLKLVKYKIYFGHQFDFTFLVYKSMANANSKQYLLLDQDNNMNRDRGKP